MSSPAQLFSCVQAVKILNSPNNTSTAKNHWTFSKSHRFSNHKVYCDSFYDIPDTKSKRKTSQGNGKKIDLNYGKNMSHIVPPPGSYNFEGFVKQNSIKQKGFSIGEGRQDTKQRSYINIESKKVPAPDTYKILPSKSSPYWTIRPRVNTDFWGNKSLCQIPGPEIYDNKDNINEKGKYTCSKYKNSKSKTFNPPKSSRFINARSNGPGPDQYYPKNDMSNHGDYVLSKNISNGKRTFLMGNRTNFVDEGKIRVKTPGPGSYRQPSDFGYYDEIFDMRTPKKISRRCSTARKK